MIVVFATFNTKKTALGIAKALLKQRVVACYSLFNTQSGWWWKGEIIDDKGPMVMFKTREENFKKVEDFINKNAGYETPEIIGIKADRVNQPYLDWVDAETK